MTSSGFQTRRLSITVFYWLFPVVPFLLLYHRGLWCWFFGDDFSLLLLAKLPDKEFWEAFWQPRAQGTFRPLSERLFFYFFYKWFGLDAFPYRLLVFATQSANLCLLSAVGARLTGLRWAGFAAACLWGVHHSLASSMTWTSAYNQVLCSFFFLLSFWLFLKFAETRRMRFYAAQWVTFLLGFGALEIMVVYPAVVLAWVLLIERRYWAHACAMLPASALLVWLQLSASPVASEGVYRPHFDPSTLAGGLWHYFERAVTADEGWFLLLVVAGGLLGVAAYAGAKGNRLPLFCLLWFAIVLGPYLPLADHRLDYYLVVPSIGLAMLGGWAVVRAFSRGKAYQGIAVVCVAAHLFGSVNRAEKEVSFYQPLSLAVKRLLADASRVRAQYPAKTILLTNVPDMLFYLSMAHDAFRVIGVFDIYLAPHNDIEPRPEHQWSIDKYFLGVDETLMGLRRGTIVVCDASRGRLVDVTAQYAGVAPLKFRDRE